MNNFWRVLLGMIPIIIIALIITFWNGYRTKSDELLLVESKNSELENQKTELKKLVQNEKNEIAKLIEELSRIKTMLQERENKLKEVQADVYRQFKVLEELAKKDPVVCDLLRSPISDELWFEIYGKTAFSRNTKDLCKGTGDVIATVPDP